MSRAKEFVVVDKNGSDVYGGPVKNPPRARDGTQAERVPTPQVNWYGHVTEPQEEFIDDGVHRGEIEPPKKTAPPKGSEPQKNPIRDELNGVVLPNED